MKLTAVILTFLYFFMHTASKTVKLNPGFRLTPLEKVIHEGSTVLMYQTVLPTFDPFLSNYTCEFDEVTCEIFQHVYTLANHTLDLLEHSLPHLSDLEDKRSRSKKAIEWFGMPAHWCCGLALSSEVKSLTMKHEALEQLTDHMQKQLKDGHDNAIKNGELLRTYSEEMKQFVGSQVRKNELLLNDVVNDTSELQQKAIIFADGLSIISKVAYRQAINMNFLKLIQQCRSNLLPSVVIESGVFMQDLQKIEFDLLRFDLTAAIPITDIQTYMQLPISTCYFSGKAVVIKINIPYISKENRYKAYELSTQPFLFQHSVCAVSITDEILIEKNGREIITLSNKQSRECASAQLCFVPKYSSVISHTQLCLENILLGKATISSIREACPHTCSKHNLEKPIILRIGPKEFGVIYPNQSISIQCDGKKDELVSTKNQVGLLTIKLTCGCKLQVGDNLIKPEHPCIKDNDMNSGSIITHEISAAWTFVGDGLYINKHTTFHNTSQLVDDEWMSHVPVYNPLVIPDEPYKPSFHQQNAHFFSYSTIVVVIIIIIVIGVTIWKGKEIYELILTMIDPIALAQKIASYIFAPAAVNEQ